MPRRPVVPVVADTYWCRGAPGGTSCRQRDLSARKAVLISTNDVRSSNAAAMYLAIGSYVTRLPRARLPGRTVADLWLWPIVLGAYAVGAALGWLLLPRRGGGPGPGTPVPRRALR
jgi:hypothetical protein